MNVLSIQSRVVLAGAVASIVACGGSGDGSQQTQPSNTSGYAGFFPSGTGSVGGWGAGAGGTSWGGAQPNNAGGTVITGQGGIIVGQAGFQPGGGGSVPWGNGGGFPEG